MLAKTEKPTTTEEFLQRLRLTTTRILDDNRENLVRLLRNRIGNPGAQQPNFAQGTRTESKGNLQLPGTMLPFEAYYESTKRVYLTRNSAGRFVPQTAGQMKLRLRSVGISSKNLTPDSISPADEVMLEIQDKRDVRFAGPLAGYDAGFYEQDGVRFLVTDSPKFINPAEGDWSTIKNLLLGLVGSDLRHGETQFNVLIGWLKVAYTSLVAGKQQPGQALALAGPVQCGKSLLQVLITVILGGRCEKPWRYMAGRTDFNSELFGAEHLMIEDDQSQTDPGSRRQLAANIKAIAVNAIHSYHGKNRDAFSLRPRWRLTISLNDNAESLGVLPPITEDVADKLILLKCRRPPNGFPTETLAQREAFLGKLISELPAFIHFLTQWEIPGALTSKRFGVTHFHHPELLQAHASSDYVSQLSEQDRRRCIVRNGAVPDTGRVMTLHIELSAAG